MAGWYSTQGTPIAGIDNDPLNDERGRLAKERDNKINMFQRDSQVIRG